MHRNRPDRREFLKLAVAGAGGILLGGANTTPGLSQTKPNVLFLLADDQRYDTIHALGNPHIHTPHLDRLVREGTAVQSAYIMGGLNAAVCVPSRAMLLTSRSAFRLRNYGQTLPPEDSTLPETFRSAGYTTFHAGKWHQDRASFARSYSMGDAIFFGGMCDQYAVGVHPYDSTSLYSDSAIHKEKGIHSSELFATAAIRFLRSKNAQNPFFACVAFTAPHDPRTAPPKYHRLYKKTELPLPPNFMPEHPFDNGELKVRDELLESHPRTPKAIQRHLADYYAMISHLDSQIGRILDTLDKTGLARNTIVVFAGDNGIALGQHGLMGKQSLYEHSIHVPLIFRGPGIATGKTSSAHVYLSDVFPTLCDLAVLQKPPSVEGESMMAGLNGAACGRDILYFAYKHFQRGLRAGPWKLILYNVRGSERTQLFNLEEDPWEIQNRSEDPACASVVKELRELLFVTAKKLGDPADITLPNWGTLEIPAWSPG